jgi:endonuclease/exonuclease/phosphatase family metal-dependent hydrolase
MDKYSLRIIAWNANGSVRAKTPELMALVKQLNIDVVLLTETHLLVSEQWTIPGYEIFRNDRQRPHPRRGGGTAILVPTSARAVQLETPDLPGMEATIVLLTTKTGPLKLVSAYGLPHKQLYPIVFYRLAPDSTVPTIVAGDLNAKHPTWNSTKTNARGKVLLAYAESYPGDLKVVGPVDPTHHHFLDGRPGDVLDIAMLYNVTTSYDISTVTALTSDHDPILLLLGDNLVHADPPLFFRYGQADWGRFRQHVHSRVCDMNILNLDSPVVIDTAVSRLSAIIRRAAHLSIPKGTRSVSSHLALPPALIECIAQKNKARGLWQAFRTTDLRVHYNKLARQLKTDIALHRRLVWEAKLATLSFKDNSVWRMAKAINRGKNPNPPLETASGIALSSSDKADAIANHLEQVFIPRPPVPGTPDLDARVVEPYATEDPIPFPPEAQISREELLQELKRLKIRKSPGPDLIGGQLILQLPGSAVEVLYQIYSKCLALSYFPTAWKAAKVISLLKPGKPPRNPASYRPISLLNIFGKVLERLVLKRIQEHVNEAQIIPRQQFGFVGKTSTEHQLLRLCNKITTGFNHGKVTAVVFLDIAKAFDSVWHPGLLFKLAKLGFHPYLVKFLQSFLQGRTFSATWMRASSSYRPIQAGVPQGSVLSPVLFNIYTADMPDLGPHVDLHLFADDNAMAASSFSPALAVRHLQRGLNISAPWYAMWRFGLNADKTSATMFCTSNRYVPTPRLELEGKPITWSATNQYLGLLLQQRLKWTCHINHILARARRRLFGLKCLLRCPAIPPLQRVRLYSQVIRPALLYAAPIWGGAAPSVLKRLQTFQNMVLRVTLSAPRFTKLSILHEATGLPRLTEVITARSRSFFAKLTDHPHSEVRAQSTVRSHPHDRFARPLSSCGAPEDVRPRPPRRRRPRASHVHPPAKKRRV